MPRWRVRLAQWQHRLLLAISATYREHDRVVSDRDKWRRECTVERNGCAAAAKENDELRKGCEELHGRLKQATAAAEHAAQQLIAERTLRQSADTRAEKYHFELIEALKSSANWNSRMVNRKSMYPEVDTPEPDEPVREPKQPIEIREKKFAREAAREGTHATLREMLNAMRDAQAASGGGDHSVQVGPETFAG